MNNDFITINCIQVTQPIGTFYIGSMKWANIINIADADIRKIDEEAKKENSFDSYLGIQRKISPSRIKEIQQYISNIDATFPTGVILHINSISKTINGKPIETLDPDTVIDNENEITYLKNINFNSENNKLEIRNNSTVARILDGQHRIEGFRHWHNINPNKELTFDLNVTIFVDLDIDDQAQIFSVINKAQTKVNKSLVYDLYDYAKHRSPQKTAHDIVRLLNKLEDSPFHRKIKVLGTANDKERETIAQATFVESIINYISKDPMGDRDFLKRKSLIGKNSLPLVHDETEKKRRFFRNLFIKEKDEVIMRILWNYFNAVKNKWPAAWDNNQPEIILNKSTGLIALMRFLKDVMAFFSREEEIITINEFESVFKVIDIKEMDLNKKNYIPGSSGQSKLYYDLLKYLDPQNNIK